MLKISLHFLFTFGLLVSGSALAQPPATLPREAVVNEVLFSIGSVSSTARDMRLYKLVLAELYQKTKISQYSKKPFDDFLLSRLSFSEASAFELKSEKSKISDAARKKLSDFSLDEIVRENDSIAVAIALIDIKEGQLRSQTRFDTWFELLKRKYQFKLKSAEIK